MVVFSRKPCSRRHSRPENTPPVVHVWCMVRFVENADQRVSAENSGACGACFFHSLHVRKRPITPYKKKLEIHAPHAPRGTKRGGYTGPSVVVHMHHGYTTNAPRDRQRGIGIR